MSNFDLDIQYLLGQHIDEEYYKKKTTNVRGKVRTHTPKFVKCGKECPLFSHCLTPQMKPYGEGKLLIAGVGESPGKEEDKNKKPFRGRSGIELKTAFANHGIVMDRDLLLLNLVQCRPMPPIVAKANKLPDQYIIESCMTQRLNVQLAEYKPDLILGFGEKVFENILESPESKRVELDWRLARKTVFWSKRYNCKVGILYHPAHMVYNPGDSSVKSLFSAELGQVLDIGSREFPSLNEDEGNNILVTFKSVEEKIESWLKDKNLPPFAFDLETKGLNPYAPGAKIIFLSISFTPEEGFGLPLDFPPQGNYWPGWTKDEYSNIIILLKSLFLHKTMKIAQNKKFDMRWIKQFLGIWPRNCLFDTMHTQHLLDERKGLSGLKAQVFILTGSNYDVDIDAKRLVTYPLKKVGQYGILDARYTKMVQAWQLGLMDKHLLKGHQLQEKVLNVFAKMEERGIKIDLKELSSQYVEAQAKIKVLKQECEDIFGKRFYAKEGRRLNINSSDQLGTLLYSILGLKYEGKETASGKYKADESSLNDLKDREKRKDIKVFIDKVIDCKKVIKFSKTYLYAWQKMVDKNDLLHPTFDLMTDTIRSNSKNPNLQNVPARNEEQKKVRKCIVPKYDCFLEGDGKAMEVAVMAMISKDKVLTRQIKDKVDIHAKWAARVFETPADKVSKEDRDFVKSNFVFPKFYGSQDDSLCGYFRQGGYEINRKHLLHCVRVMEKEYHDLFEWQGRLKYQYKTKGYVEMPTGFRRRGPLDDNQVINTPIQHLSTWIMFGGMVEIDKIMVGEKFTSGMNIEVHDSITIDAVSSEVDDSFEIADREFCKPRFDWMGDVPVTVAWSFGRNWLDMDKI